MIDNGEFYLEISLPNGFYVYDIIDNGDHLLISDSDCNEIPSYKLENLEFRLFRSVKINDFNDLLYFLKSKKSFFVESHEPESILNSFPNQSIHEDGEFMDREVEVIDKACYGILVKSGEDTIENLYEKYLKRFL